MSFVLSRDGRAKLRVYNLRGELVRTLVDGDLTAGPHTLTWAGRDDTGQRVASGTYLLRLEAPDLTRSRLITLVK